MNNNDIENWFADNPETNSAYVAACDINGVLRGKRIPASHVKKITDGAMRMPLSAVYLDIWGEDLRADGGVFQTGDKDGLCESTGRGVYR